MKKIVNQFMRFCITGGINAVIDFIIYLSLTRFFNFWSQHLVMATAIAFLIASTNGYFMNKYWTFKDNAGKHHVQYPKFLIVMTIGLGINALCFYFLAHYMGINDIVSKILVAFIVLFWNFSLNKLWTFIKPKQASI
ncbi:MAG: GtrA family protein [Patescibacteria group bacterium]